MLQMLSIVFYYFSAGLAAPEAIGAVGLITQILCWVIAAVTALSGAQYIWNNRQFINTAK